MQRQCPKCGSFKVTHISSIIVAAAIAIGLVGIFIWPLLILAVFVGLFGIITAVTAHGRLGRMAHKCQTCGFQW